MADVTVQQVFRIPGGTLREAANHPLVCSTRHVGVEVELEGIGGMGPMENWAVTGDGSLRDGVEFVFDGPKSGAQVYEALEELDNTITAHGAIRSWRCSTHAHFNVRMCTARNLKNINVAFLYTEKVMFRLAGIHRYRNNFCPAFGFAQSQLVALSRIWDMDGRDFIAHLSQITSKYSSLNFNPLSSFGSIEFRMAEPKTQRGQLLRLINRFLAIIDFAIRFEGTPAELLDTMRGMTLEELFPMGLPAEGVPDIGDDLDVGYKLAMDLLAMAANHQRARDQEGEEPDEVPEPRMEAPRAAFRPRAARVRAQPDMVVGMDEDVQEGAAPGRFVDLDPERYQQLERLWTALHADMMARQEERNNRR